MTGVVRFGSLVSVVGLVCGGLSACQQPASSARPLTSVTASVPEARSYLQALKDDRIGRWSPEGEYEEFAELVEAGVHHGRIVSAKREVKYQFFDSETRNVAREAIRKIIEDPEVDQAQRWTRSPAEGFQHTYTRRRADGSVEQVRFSWVDGARPVLWVVQRSTPVAFIDGERVAPLP